MTRWRGEQLDGPFTEFAAQYAGLRATQPVGCSHCGTEDVPLTNYSRNYGGNVGAHWLCAFCEVTRSASRLGAGGNQDDTVADVAAMLNRLVELIRSSTS